LLQRHERSYIRKTSGTWTLFLSIRLEPAAATRPNIASSRSLDTSLRTETKSAGLRLKEQWSAVATAVQRDCSVLRATSASASSLKEGCKKASGNPVNCLEHCLLPFT